jgi:hypothetical protein
MSGFDANYYKHSKGLKCKVRLELNFFLTGVKIYVQSEKKKSEG